MRILMLSWEYPPKIVGGISRVVHDLAQKMGEMGNEVHVITCWEEGMEEVVKEKNVLVHRVRTYDLNARDFIDWVHQMNMAFVEYCIQLFNQIGVVDIIHAHDWIVAFAARILKHGYLVPLVSTIHATEAGRNWGIHNDIQKHIHSVEWWLSYESWKIIVNSGYMRSEVTKLLHVPEDKIFVIPNGIDGNKFKNYERDYNFRRNYAMDNEKIVFFVGRLVNEKGVHVLVDSIPKVISSYNNVKVVIAGKGPEFENLLKKASMLNISHKVLFTGYIPDEDLNRLFKCSDIAVFPSLYEPFGIVALEGIIAGLPVVVSDTGGLGEIIRHGVDGMKFYTGNPDSLADNILYLLFNPDMAEKMKCAAVEQVMSEYNWDIIARKTIDVYKKVTDERSASCWENPDIKGYMQEHTKKTLF